MAELNYYLPLDGGPSYKETSPFICIANQWTGFYVLGTSVMKELKKTNISICFDLFMISVKRLQY